MEKGTKMSNEFKSWEEMSTLEQYACTFWDMYKDAYGVRPRGINTDSWTEADFEEEFESLSKEIQREEADRQVREAQATMDFEARIQTIIISGAGDRATALRWIHDAENTNGDDEYLCYTVGLPYGYFRKVA